MEGDEEEGVADVDAVAELWSGYRGFWRAPGRRVPDVLVKKEVAQYGFDDAEAVVYPPS